MPTQAGISIQKNIIWNHQEGSWWLVVGYSPTGWMTADITYENIGNISTPHLGKHNDKFPVILFVDGHCTHITYQLSELWSGLDSIFISLYSIATRLLQPLKLGWTTAVLEWHGKSLTNYLTRNGSLLSWMVFEPVACIHGMQKQLSSQNILGKKLPRNASSTHPGKTETNKMFQETLGRQLIRVEEKEKNEAESVLKRLIETSWEELELQGSNKNLMLKYHRLLQIALLWMKILAQLLPYI